MLLPLLLVLRLRQHSALLLLCLLLGLLLHLLLGPLLLLGLLLLLLLLGLLLLLRWTLLVQPQWNAGTNLPRLRSLFTFRLKRPCARSHALEHWWVRRRPWRHPTLLLWRQGRENR